MLLGVREDLNEENIGRRKEIFKDVITSKGDANYKPLKSLHKNKVQSPAQKKFYNYCYNK